MIAENEKDDTKKGSRDREKVCRKKEKEEEEEGTQVDAIS